MFVPEVPQDPRFPQLATMADPQQMKMLLQHQLPGFKEGELHIDQLKIKRFQYKPGQSCKVCYSLSVHNQQGDQQGTQLLYGVVDSNGAALAAHRNSAMREPTSPRLSPAIHYLDQLDMALWGFPNDPVMTGLPELFDGASFRNLLQKYGVYAAWPQHGAMQADVVKYVPGVRCVIEHRLWNDPAKQGSPDGHLFSKSYGNERGAAAFAVMKALWQSEARQRSVLNIPQPLLYDPQLCVLITPALIGEEALASYQKTGNLGIFTQIGRLLAAFHQTPMSPIESRSADKINVDLHEVMQTLNQFALPAARQTAALQELLHKRAGALPAMPTTPVHGAFRINQIKLVDERATLFDFDGVYMGNPIGDVGGFVAHLYYLTTKGDLSIRECHVASQHFCRAYAEAAPWSLPQDAVDWTVAALLVGKHIKKLVKRGRTDGEAQRMQLLALAHNILTGTGAPTS